MSRRGRLKTLLAEHRGSASAATVQPGRYQVEGVVRLADASPAAGLDVLAVDRDLRNEERLGTATTGSDGEYRIEFSEQDFLDRERGGDGRGIEATGVKVSDAAPRIG